MAMRCSLPAGPRSGCREFRIAGKGWRGAARADNFAEVNPGDAIAPPVESEAWIAYDAENLYVALIARDDPARSDRPRW